jgi:hypothetical protein
VTHGLKPGCHFTVGLCTRDPEISLCPLSKIALVHHASIPRNPLLLLKPNRDATPLPCVSGPKAGAPPRVAIHAKCTHLSILARRARHNGDVAASCGCSFSWLASRSPLVWVLQYRCLKNRHILSLSVTASTIRVSRSVCPGSPISVRRIDSGPTLLLRKHRAKTPAMRSLSRCSKRVLFTVSMGRADLVCLLSGFAGCGRRLVGRASDTKT